MASSQSRASDRMIHQDYIARIRYSNALPPPPNPPKLLDIPNTGLASGQYTTPGFASRLSRDQPLNIEADAELGMPLDLVGMPGIFDGDESSIQAPLHAPAAHPHDRALLRPLSTLGKPKFSDSGVSFLRRTEYISSYTSKSRFDSTTSRSLIDNTGNRIKRPTARNLDTESPSYIKEQVLKSFQTAALNLKDPSRIRHPTKRNVKLVDSYPLLPDLEAFPDFGGYVIIKFLTNPVPPSSSYDSRLENAIFRPTLTPEEGASIAAQEEAYRNDPEHNPPPDAVDYEFFLTETSEGAQKFKRKFDVFDPEHDDEELYTHKNDDGDGCFRFKRIRAYETSAMFKGDDLDNEVVLTVHDGKDGLRQKAAYYYPVVIKTSIGPQRKKNIDRQKLGMLGVVAEEETKPTDFVDVRVVRPTGEVVRLRQTYDPFRVQAEEEEEEEEVVVVVEEEQAGEDGGTDEEGGDGKSRRKALNSTKSD